MYNNILFKFSKKGFFDGLVPTKPVIYTVVVVYLSGVSKEYVGIEKPWSYISQVKKNPKVKTAYIKS